MSDFGGNNEADSKLRQHCIALERENARLKAELYKALDVNTGLVQARLLDKVERDALATQLADAKERIVQLEDEYKYTRAAIRDGLSEAENIAYPVTREKVLFIRQRSDALATRCGELEAAWTGLEQVALKSPYACIHIDAMSNGDKPWWQITVLDEQNVVYEAETLREALDAAIKQAEPSTQDLLCAGCGAVLIAACECPHCGMAMQDQPSTPK